MVVLTIVAQKNGETIYFDQSIPQVHYMRLVSCCLYKSWHNLKAVGAMFYNKPISPKHTNQVFIAQIPQGHYNLVSLVKELKSSIDEEKSELKIIKIETNKPNSVFKLFNPDHDRYQINVSHDLAGFIGTGTKLGAETYVKKLNSPSAYFIHCNLIDKTKNFFNRKRSDVLAKIDIRGMPYDKVTYPSLPQDALRECSTGEFVNQITLSVKDESGEMFDFNGLPIEFVLELN